jgi:putative hydrolase of the HAD superfamily
MQTVLNQPSHLIEIVSFDIWNTILRHNLKFTEQRKQLIFQKLRCEVKNIDFEFFLECFTTTQKEIEHLSEQTGRHLGQDVRLLALAKKLDVGNLDIKILHSIEDGQKKLLEQFPPLLLDATIPKLFREIHKSGRKVAVISNTGLLGSDHVRLALKNQGLTPHIDRFIFSEEIGYAKPNPLMFLPLTDLVTSKEAILHIGDNKFADFEGAQRVGFSAMHTDHDVLPIQQIKKILSIASS